jgi:hypothetical protein
MVGDNTSAEGWILRGATDEKMTHRYTEDDRICADKFKFENKVYSDCTVDKSPDNK